jgi:hypothetical protein
MTKHNEKGKRQSELRPFYASFFYLDHLDGNWSVYRTKKDAVAAWKAMGRKAGAIDLLWVRLAERGDLVDWIMERRVEDLITHNTDVMRAKQDLLKALGVASHV